MTTTPHPQPADPPDPVDPVAVLADLQEQLDDLTATVQAPQQSSDRLDARLDGRA